MTITVVNDYDFKPDGDVAAGKAAAAGSGVKPVALAG